MHFHGLLPVLENCADMSSIYTSLSISELDKPPSPRPDAVEPRRVYSLDPILEQTLVLSSCSVGESSTGTGSMCRTVPEVANNRRRLTGF